PHFYPVVVIKRVWDGRGCDVPLRLRHVLRPGGELPFGCLAHGFSPSTGSHVETPLDPRMIASGFPSGCAASLSCSIFNSFSAYSRTVFAVPRILSVPLPLTKQGAYCFGTVSAGAASSRSATSFNVMATCGLLKSIAWDSANCRKRSANSSFVRLSVIIATP